MQFKDNMNAEGSLNRTHTSDVWQQLLNDSGMEAPSISDTIAPVPPLASDPWTALLNAQGIQIVDLQQVRLRDVHVSLNEQDVEQALYLMQEQNSAGINEG